MLKHCVGIKNIEEEHKMKIMLFNINQQSNINNQRVSPLNSRVGCVFQPNRQLTSVSQDYFISAARKIQKNYNLSFSGNLFEQISEHCDNFVKQNSSPNEQIEQNVINFINNAFGLLKTEELDIDGNKITVVDKFFPDFKDKIKATSSAIEMFLLRKRERLAKVNSDILTNDEVYSNALKNRITKLILKMKKMQLN